MFSPIFWYYNKFTQQSEHRNHWKSLYFSILLKTESKLQQNSMCRSKKIKTLNKISVISKTIFLVFYYKILMAPPILPKTMCLKIPFFFLELSLLGSRKSHHHSSKNNKNSKFKLAMFHDQSLSKCLVHPNHVLILPP